MTVSQGLVQAFMAACMSYDIALRRTNVIASVGNAVKSIRRYRN